MQPWRHLEEPQGKFPQVRFKGSLRPFHRPYRTLRYVSSSTAPTNSPRITTSTRIRISGAITIWQTPGIALKGLDQDIRAKFDGIFHYFWYFSMLRPTNQKVKHMLSMAKSSAPQTFKSTSTQLPPV